MSKILFREAVAKFLDKKGKVLEPFLSDLEAKSLLKRLSPTSLQYIKLRKKEVEAEFDKPLSAEAYRVFRDSIIAEVCNIELNDPKIRKAHGLEPAE